MQVPAVICRKMLCRPATRRLGLKCSAGVIVLLGILVCAAPLTAQIYKGSTWYEGPSGMTSTPLVINLTISGSSITGTLGIGSAGANMPVIGTRTGNYCKVTASGAGGRVFTGICTAGSFSGTCTIGSTTCNFSLKAAYTPPPPNPPAPIPAPPPSKPTPTAPIPAPLPSQQVPPAPIAANPPSVPAPPLPPPPCVIPVVAPSEPSPGAPSPVATKPPQPAPEPIQTPAPAPKPAPPISPAPTPIPVQRTIQPPAPAPKPALQPGLYCGTFTNTTFHFTGYLEIRVDPGSHFSGEISVGQEISGTSQSTFGSGTFTGFIAGTSCGATDSGGLQFKGTCTATSISTSLYSIDKQSGSFSVTTAGCANKK
jgi:hypothetical protein